METTIRAAEISDYDQLCTLFAEENRFHRELVPDHIQTTLQLLTVPELEAYISNAIQNLFVAEKCPELFGAVIISIKEDQEDRWHKYRRVGYIEDLIVTAGARGRGVGRQLMQAARQWAASNGVQTIELHVWQANHGARRFYESLGMKALQQRLAWRI